MIKSSPKKVILTIDVESLLHAHPMYQSLSSARKCEADSDFTLRATCQILKLLDNYRSKATFFMVADISQWYPGLCDQISDKGHEIAYHTSSHDIMTSPDNIESDLNNSMAFLQKWKPRGFRAPFYRLPEAQQSFKILQNYGFIYDSSCYGSCAASEVIEGFHEFYIPLIPYFRKPPLTMDKHAGLQISDIVRDFPLGSGLSWSFPRRFLDYFLNRAFETSIAPIVTIHPWQLLPKPRHLYFLKTSFLITRPWWLPYSISAATNFACFLRQYETIGIRDYLDCTLEMSEKNKE